MYRKFFKRLFDFVFALFGFIFLLPLFLLIVLLLCIANKGDVFFLQLRPGKIERLFKVIKFKTMNDRTDKSGNLLSDEIRLTRVGNFIRKTSLDEIPQLINVIKGDMSLVGPRPLLVQYLHLYNDNQRERHNVRPGITGWAQVNGRNAISWKKKFEYDCWYVKNLSFILDIRIIILTMQKVIAGEGISSATSSTVEYFSGNSE